MAEVVDGVEQGFRLLCPIDACWTIDVEAPSGGYDAGDVVKIGDTVAVIVSDAAKDSLVTAIVRAPIILLPCAASTGEFVAGYPIAYEPRTGDIVGETSGNVICGICRKTPAVGDTWVECCFDGMLAVL
ncbi:MAG TPA: hypothetical protein PK650_13095 [Candidatus Sumerlaeota bacterium]|nr:hypothetical protein [Candidatus Sumerlaeota bacterium]HOE64678.1 hypothetical protein [Candidatus Sumerlaeota bacterium]